ncbi:hypothetical protein MY3296_009696, partial [Beauveria thailandica]
MNLRHLHQLRNLNILIRPPGVSPITTDGIPAALNNRDSHIHRG